MFKLINIDGDDLRLDVRGISKMVTSACRRSGCRVEGMAMTGDRVTLICTSEDSANAYSYNFTALEGAESCDDIYAEIRCRYDNHFRVVGVFPLADGYWSLTEKKENQ